MSDWPNAVTIGSFLADVEADGNFRITTKIEGWGSPARRLNTNDLTGRAGAWVSGGLYGARTVVHTGYIEQATPAAAKAIADELAAFAPGTPTTYTVEHETLGALQVTAHVAVGPEPDWDDDKSFGYSLTLVAPDPFKRPPTADVQTVAGGGSVSFTAAGNVPAEIEVTTTSSGTIALSAGSLTLRTSSVPAGTVLTSGPGFDNPKRTIVGPSGENLFGLTLSPMQWPAVVPGANTLTQAGTAGLSVRYFPTYA